ncbi:hypothetical protein NIES2100_14150 [Calothrix sp. NIES-2100]|nr:hypothetical protein NIES2100_14150 [Calothrix sp. NIES-2100]
MTAQPQLRETPSLLPSGIEVEFMQDGEDKFSIPVLKIRTSTAAR